MSYDIYLKDPVTGETAEVPGHLMIGGTYKADYHPETGAFTPALNTEAHLNITYNYSEYYHLSDETKEEGIRTIYGLTGLDAVPVLEGMIKAIRDKYHDGSDWITTDREKAYWTDDADGQEADIGDLLDTIAGRDNREYTRHTCTVKRYEGATDRYWDPTAANAERPLHKLIALARMRPDCIFDGD